MRQEVTAFLGTVSLIFGSTLLVSQTARAAHPKTDRGRGALSAGSPAAAASIAGSQSDWWSGAQREIRESEYRISSPQRPGGSIERSGFQAPNRAQNLRTRFLPEGIDVTPRVSANSGSDRPAVPAPAAPAWEWKLQLRAWGRGEQTAPVREPVLSPMGNRMEYRRGDILEWYRNDERGLEQGFVLSVRPPGSNGAVRLRFDVGGTVQAVAAADGQSVSFLTGSGARAIHFGALQARDAAGHALASRFKVEGRMLSIEVEDTGAVYPLTIDPLATSSSWTADGGQAGAELGFSVSTAGDVNGDGYSDVIVGANLYDGGDPDDGAAFVFLGSASGLSNTPAWTGIGSQGTAHFGASVSCAGDVNGDGYSDVIVGTPLYNGGGHSNEGQASVFLGSATGLAATAAWTYESGQSGAQLGYCVSTAGDVNGDGYDDVIVGARNYNGPSLSNEGEALVFFGSATGPAATPSWTAASGQAGARFGTSVATAGDVNGDGYADVIVGAPSYDNTQAGEGRAYVYLGSATGPAASPAWTIDGGQAGAALGASVAAAGDVNGDGYADVIVGAPAYQNTQAGEGRATVYLGAHGGLSTTATWTVYGGQASAALGSAVAGAGDVNGDGYADVIVGAPLYQHTLAAEGRATVYFGSSAGPAATASWTEYGGQAGAQFGAAVGAAGDIDGDGYGDVVVGAPLYSNTLTNEGRAFVFNGSAAGPSTTASWTSESNQINAYFGTSVASAGDVNGDGYADVIVGAPGYDHTLTDEGAAFVFLGSATGTSTTAAWSAYGGVSAAHFGASVSTAGDVNGDGYSDVIVGAPQYLVTGHQGLAQVFLGSSTGLSPTAAWTGSGAQATSQYGASVAAAGDVNGDGYGDVIVGDPGYNVAGGNTGAGRADVYLGSSGGLATSPVWTSSGDGKYEAAFGFSVATAGDVNGDGYSDILVGAPHDWEQGVGLDQGIAFAFYGSATGPARNFNWSTAGYDSNAELGTSVSTAGDVNGDGYSDVIVGAPHEINGALTDCGWAEVFTGSSTGLSGNLQYLEGDQTNEELGSSVSTAGDVNGDGLSDVAVGAPGYSNTQASEGRVTIYLGQSNGIVSPTAAWTAYGGQAGSSFGAAVSAAGDVNGDGYSDLLVGAYNYSNGQLREGRASVYNGGGGGLVLNPRQLQISGVPLSYLEGTGDPSSIRLAAAGRSAAGRSRVRLVWRAAQLSTPLNSAPLGLGSWWDSGAPGSPVALNELVTGLPTLAPCHWMLRVQPSLPGFAGSPWSTVAPSVPSLEQFRTTAGWPVAVETKPPLPSRFLSISPTPFRAFTEIRIRVPAAGLTRVEVIDAAGRHLRDLVNGDLEAGSHITRWDGRDDRGRRQAAGVYYVRLSTRETNESRAVVLVQ